jgi:hypothetical protein
VAEQSTSSVFVGYDPAAFHARLHNAGFS